MKPVCDVALAAYDPNLQFLCLQSDLKGVIVWFVVFEPSDDEWESRILYALMAEYLNGQASAELECCQILTWLISIRCKLSQENKLM